MTQTRLADITHLPEVDVREFIRPEAVERYAEILDNLPPITLTRLPDGTLVLTDGRHRIAAAERIGRKTIKADITNGDLAEAIVAAATANATHGVPFSREEQKRAALHLWESDEGSTNKRFQTHEAIAEAIGVSPTSVGHWLSAERTRRELGTSFGAERSLPDAQLEELRAVPASLRQQAAEVAAQNKWHHREVRKIAKVLADPAISDEDKRDVLASIVRPGDNGEATIGVDLVAEVLRASKPFSAAPQVHAFIGAAYALLDHLKRDPDVKGMTREEWGKLAAGVDEAQEAVNRLRIRVNAAKSVLA